MESAVSAKDDGKAWPLETIFSDAHGRRHVHAPEEATYEYSCKAGHAWTRKACHSCWCGWSKYLEANVPSIRVYFEIQCAVGEDNLIIVDRKWYKAYLDFRMETKSLMEAEEIILENEAAFYSLLRGEL